MYGIYRQIFYSLQGLIKNKRYFNRDHFGKEIHRSIGKIIENDRSMKGKVKTMDKSTENNSDMQYQLHVSNF